MQREIDVISEVTRVLNLEGQAMLRCAERLQGDGPKRAMTLALELLRDSLSQGGKIVVTGIGKSGKIGQKIAATLCSTGSLAVYLHPTEGLHGDLGLVSPSDVVLALSYTGNTEEVVRLLPALRSMRVKVISICGNLQSKLALQSDVCLDGWVEQEACPHNLAPTTSTTLALAIGDALAVTLMQLRGFDAQGFAQNHPGGSIGNRLTLRVSDLMHQGDGVATVSPEASIDEVIEGLTRKMLGGVLVVDGSRLLGLIVDGDLRRALQKREQFFSLKAQDLMTRSPIVVAPETMAKAALELMENRPSQISVLPVVGQDGHWKGLIRLHDIIRAF
jgi:arabinose-5-phosphate isomerase